VICGVMASSGGRLLRARLSYHTYAKALGDMHMSN
jgi:hypothetical protein